MGVESISFHIPVVNMLIRGVETLNVLQASLLQFNIKKDYFD